MRSLIEMYREVLGIFPPEGSRFLRAYVIVLASLAIFDVAALMLLAAVVGPVAAGSDASLPGIGTLDETGLVWAIGVVCALLLVKGVAGIAAAWWATRRVPRFEVAIGDKLFRNFISAPWRDRLRKNSTEIMRFADAGVNSAVNSFMLPGATLAGELVSLSAVVVTLAAVEPVLAVIALGYLALIGLILFFWVARHTRRAGEINVENTVRTARLVNEIVSAMKEVTLRNKESEVADVVEAVRTRSARARGNIYFLSQVPRYALEAGLVGGFIVVGGSGWLLGGMEQAVTGVALFALAGFRVAPSVIRFQSVLSQMIAVQPYVRHVLDELESATRGAATVVDRPVAQLPADPKTITLADVSYSYDDDAELAVRDVTIEIPMGSFVAFVGASGSGKSTLVDLILGLLEPTRGSIDVDGLPLAHLRDSWRSRLGYVPQEATIFDATIAQNVALTWSDAWDAARVRHALERAQLWELVSEREGGIRARVGERGMALSGGQRQRLGIARALYAEPLVLVMDEATSALDTETEAQVSQALVEIGAGVTKIVVAHRLSTVTQADRIYFMRQGAVVGAGTFDELVTTIPDFAHQARLAGLVSGEA